MRDHDTPKRQRVYRQDPGPEKASEGEPSEAAQGAKIGRGKKTNAGAQRGLPAQGISTSRGDKSGEKTKKAAAKSGEKTKKAAPAAAAAPTLRRQQSSITAANKAAATVSSAAFDKKQREQLA